MKHRYQERVNTRVKAIAAALPKNAGEAAVAFVHQFYAKTPLSDLEHIAPARAAAIAASALAFMGERKPAEPKMRFFTPAKREHGYESRRLVLELLNDDMPFLVDSLTAALSRAGFTVYETIHPILQVVRDRKGKLLGIAEAKDKEASAESFIHFELSPLPADADTQAIERELLHVLAAIRAAVTDWPAMAAKAVEAEKELAKLQDKSKEVTEAHGFLHWLSDRNFVFLGYADGDERLGLAALDKKLSVPSNDALLSVTKTDKKSLVHRAVLMDAIALKTFDKNGKPSGERQFFGLFTSSVYYQTAEAIPLVGDKVERVMKRSGFAAASHDGKALKTILEFLPRDELFQYDEDELFETALGILALEARPGVRLFVRRDPHERFVSCMAFVPREYFSTELRKAILGTVAAVLHGSVETFTTQITDSPLARLHFVVRTTPGDVPEVDVAAVEADIARYTHQWSDDLRAALAVRFGEAEGEQLYRTFGAAFPSSYVTRYTIPATVFDIDKCNAALTQNALVVDLYRVRAEPDALHLKIYNPSEEIALSDILPVLEHMGLRAIDEHPFLISPEGGHPVWIRDFKLVLAEPRDIVLSHVKPLFEEALLAIWQRTMESDRFNALTLKAELSWRQVTMLRAYAKYMKQIGFTYSQQAISHALVAYPAITKLIVALFEARFDPATKDASVRMERLAAQIEAQLAEVSALSDDVILRHYLALIQATLRTNYYQEARPVLSFKLRSGDVPNMPKPVPFVEIFVYGTRVEGIHLRGGKVARGGLRWSDRSEDFRTEVLGLMKAQMVKNAVIVPVGSKGGFVLKQPPANPTREAMQEEGIACYTLYLQGLLDITDNITAKGIVPPKSVVRYDEDDPYLVVAADKGTASFSDIANGVSRSYGFWLDDAFASGGSAGYDHKKMGITARGGWVSVTRHFREMGRDIAKENFTAVGVGDMSGDVFGNGVLLSDRMQLVAAFNHMHIFIDPSPDAKASFAERQRLFDLPRSTWKDYDAKLISKGGGIYERSAKSIRISSEAKAALGLTKENFAPDDLIRAILLAPVDLLWNGGIGTYVKAEDETHDQVGDRANNSVRVNGKELRCKVVGEGGNLGFTQKGRVEYARAGGRLNTDAIDNSGGVDCSDHEVNIKIAFSSALSSGRITREKRDQILAKMTEEVGALVLRDNMLQTQAVSLAEHQGAALLESQARLMRRLEAQGLLDRAIEYLPSDRQIEELRSGGKGLTRPELAVLLAYSKLALFKEIMDSGLTDEPYFAVDLARYFPKPMQKDFASDISAHRLKREIIATVATNSLVNRVGLTFFFDIVEDSNQPGREVAAAYTVARDAFSLRPLWAEIESLGAGVDTATQLAMLAEINKLIERVTLWGLRRLPHPIALEAAVAELAPGIEQFKKAQSAMHSPATQKAAEKVLQQMIEGGAPEALAATIASLDMLASACDVIQIAKASGLSIKQAGVAYFALGGELKLGWLRHYAGRVRTQTHWDRLAARALIQDVFDEQRRLTEEAIQAGGVEAWRERYAGPLARYAALLQDLEVRESLTLSALLVALKHVRML